MLLCIIVTVVITTVITDASLVSLKVLDICSLK
jgi:hypothetical protein